ncbi:ANTAR domain-containing protein [Streptomyces sp. NPDC058274]|uniref:ANTAR domain-containing protein n=1 Tax=Streptomyces sp. NPDC058274 TaxID=3346416 RepID=UPI0036EA2301
MSERMVFSQVRNGDEPCAASTIPSTRRRPLSLQAESYPAGDRVLVVVSGDIDLDTDQVLLRALRDALARSVSGVDLDLSGVDFCDCSGLNILLCMRRRALEEGRTIAVRAVSAPVDRLLTVTGTRSLFAGADDAGAESPDPGPGPADSTAWEDPLPDDAEHDLRVELVQLRRAMRTRPAIDLARGVLMASFGLSPEDAWHVLVTLSQRTNTKLHHVAQALVDTVRGEPLDEPVQRQLAAAVARHRTPPPTPPPASSAQA